MATMVRRTWRRRLLRATLVLVVLLLLIVAALPRLLGTAPGRAFLLARVNQAIAPGRLEAKAFRFSWAGPIRAEGVVLRGPEGKAIVTAPSAVWDRGLWRLLTDRPHYGTITLEKAACDVTRRPDGTIDLVDALGLGAKANPGPVQPPGKPSAPTVATLKIVGGSLKLQSPELPHGLSADRFDMTLDQPAPPAERTFKVSLARAKGETLEIAGTLDAASAPSLALSAKRWATDLAMAGVEGRGVLDGKAQIDLRGDKLAASGDATLSSLDATGPTLGGDRVRLDRIAGTWDVARGDAGWTVRRLDVTSPIASLRSDRPIPAPPGASATITGRFDLAALAEQAPHALRLREGLDLRSGEAEVQVVVHEESGTQRLAVSAKLSDVDAVERGRATPIVLREPAMLTANITAKGRAVTVERLGLSASGLTAQGSGDLEKGVLVTGRCDLATVEAQIRDLIDLHGIDLAGRGRFVADYRRHEGGYHARYKVEVDDFTLARPDAEPIARQFVKIEGEAFGPIDVSGLPASWRTALIGLGLPEMAASITLTPRSDGLAVTVAANRPMLLDGRPAMAEVSTVALWNDSGLEIAELIAKFKAPAPAPVIAIAATGRYDLAGGTLTLAPTPGGSIAIAPKGLRVAGLGSGSQAMTFDGGIVGDLSAVDRLWAAYEGSTPYGLDGPCGLALRAEYDTASGRLALDDLTVTSQYGSAATKGHIDDLTGQRHADLGGVLTIDPATLDSWVASAVSPTAKVTARARPFHLRGPLSGDILHQIEADGGLDLDGAEVAGLKLGPAQVVARLLAGKVTVEPIRSTLNGGEVVILSDVTLEEAGGATVHLLPGTAIRGAVIDKALSDELLSYAAPILHEATQVDGRVSMTIDRADFPVGGPVARPVSLAGTVGFENVIFGPGPAAAEILTLVPLKRSPQIKLDETIRVAVEKGRVYQSGLEVPISGKESFGLEGSVGFDHTLALRALVPLDVPNLPGEAGRFLNAGKTGDVRIPVPIGGTFAQPRIDRRALAKGVRDGARQTIRREAENGANDLIRRLGSEIIPRRR